MDGPTLRALVLNGYAIAADNLGDPYDWYRSPDTNAPIKQINRIGVVTAAFSEAGFNFRQSPSYNKPVWSMLFNADGELQHGDYFVSRETGRTFFLSSPGSPFEPVAVLCNYLFDVKRPEYVPAAGLGSYGGVGAIVVGSEVPIMSGWPGRIYAKSHGTTADVKLPSAPKLPWEEILLPFAGVRIEFADVLVGVPLQTLPDLTRPTRFIVSSNELTELGWRMLAAEAAP